MKNKRRWIILKELLENKNPVVGAEIGILTGRMTLHVLNKLPSIKKYYAIDPWENYPTYKDSLLKEHAIDKFKQENMDQYFKKFKEDTKKFKDKIKILKMFSNEAHKHIKDKSLDFCFIDGNHSYKYVKEDILNFIPKIKNGMLIGGHDYNQKDVKKAVNEIFGNNVITGLGNSTWWKWI